MDDVAGTPNSGGTAGLIERLLSRRDVWLIADSCVDGLLAIEAGGSTGRVRSNKEMPGLMECRLSRREVMAGASISEGFCTGSPFEPNRIFRGRTPSS